MGLRTLPFFKTRKGWHVAGTGYEDSGGGGGYTLPVANASTLGGVKVGDGLSIDENGVLSSSSSSVSIVTQSYSTSKLTIGGNGDSLVTIDVSKDGKTPIGVKEIYVNDDFENLSQDLFISGWHFDGNSLKARVLNRRTSTYTGKLYATVNYI